MQNFCYTIVRANNVVFEITIIDFPLMNLSDLITMTKILSQVDKSQILEENQVSLVVRHTNIKAFTDCYSPYFPETDIDLAMAINKTSKVPKALLRREA